MISISQDTGLYNHSDMGHTVPDFNDPIYQPQQNADLDTVETTPW